MLISQVVNGGGAVLLRHSSLRCLPSPRAFHSIESLSDKQQQQPQPDKDRAASQEQDKPNESSSDSQNQGNSGSSKSTSTIQSDEELRENLDKMMSGDGGLAGVELENGKAVGLKRGVKSNMFRLI